MIEAGSGQPPRNRRRAEAASATAEAMRMWLARPRAGVLDVAIGAERVTLTACVDGVERFVTLSRSDDLYVDLIRAHRQALGDEPDR